MNVPVDLNEMYENKTDFYQKLNGFCYKIHDFQRSQDLMYQKGKFKGGKVHEIPDWSQFEVQLDQDKMLKPVAQ